MARKLTFNKARLSPAQLRGRRGRVAPAPPVIALDGTTEEPLQRQLYHALRSAILARRLAPGARLPSSRQYAESLELSRTTVAAVYDQLRAEGYIEGRERSGTFIARALPDDSLEVRRGRLSSGLRKQAATAGPEQLASSPARSANLPAGTLSRRGSLLASLQVSSSPTSRVEGPRAFRLGTPALDAFPFVLWGRLLSRRWRRLSAAELAYGSAAGHPALRSAIAAHVRSSRAVSCHPEQVLIVSGAQQAFDLVSRVLLDVGDVACVEDPGYGGVRAALAGAGVQLVPVAMDAEGIDVATGVARVPNARLVCVTPSHQFPLGVTMSAARRLALLEWARGTGSWILEDDFDSEYRFRGRPLPSLQGMDTHERVLYVGTFSKTLFPSLRIGFLIVPSALAEPFARARAVSDRHSPQLEQAVLADFIAEGHLGRHIRRMRGLYAQREATLRALLAQSVGEFVSPERSDAGMHLVAWVHPGESDRRLSDLAGAAGVVVSTLSALSTRRPPRGALLLGFAAFDEEAMQRGVDAMRSAWLGARTRVFATGRRRG